jgi:hypothetical protein
MVAMGLANFTWMCRVIGNLKIPHGRESGLVEFSSWTRHNLHLSMLRFASIAFGRQKEHQCAGTTTCRTSSRAHSS